MFLQESLQNSLKEGDGKGEKIKEELTDCQKKLAAAKLALRNLYVNRDMATTRGLRQQPGPINTHSLNQSQQQVQSPNNRSLPPFCKIVHKVYKSGNADER